MPAEGMMLMKCPNCGAEVTTKFCEYCGSEMPKENATIYITNNYYGSTPQVHNNAPVSSPGGNTAVPKKKKSRAGLWVLGWLFIFPLPLTILLLRKKDMKPVLKYGIIVIAWLLFFMLGTTAPAEEEPVSGAVPTYSQSLQENQTC